MKKFDGYLSQISSILIGAYSHGYEEGFEKAKARFGKRERPAADVAPVRHGRWERVIPSKSAAKWSTRVSCSNCHSAGYAHHKYCPNCGTKMDGGADNG